MYLPHKVDHYKQESSVTTGTLQYKTPTYTLERKDIRCYIQPAGFKDRTTLLGHMAEEPWAIYLNYRADHNFAQGDELRQTVGGSTATYEIIVPPRVHLHDHIKCICKRVKT